MIIVKLTGGMSNQIYQYASGYWLARVCSQELYLDISSVVNGYFRGFIQDYFDLPEKHRITKNIDPEILFGEEFYYCSGTDIETEIVNLLDKKNIYFKSPPFFGNNKNPFFKEAVSPFVFNGGIKEVEAFRNRIKGKVSVGIHFRRGDLLREAKRINSDSFWRAAIVWFRKKYRNPFFFVFSDDIDYACNTLGIDNDISYVSFPGYMLEAAAELICLSSCNHRILTAGSSFSVMACEMHAVYSQENSVNVFQFYSDNWLSDIKRSVRRYIRKKSNMEILCLKDKEISRLAKRYSAEYKRQSDSLLVINDLVIDETDKTSEKELAEIIEQSFNIAVLSSEDKRYILYLKFLSLCSLEEYDHALQLSFPLYYYYRTDKVFLKNLFVALKNMGFIVEAFVECQENDDSRNLGKTIKRIKDVLSKYRFVVIPEKYNNDIRGYIRGTVEYADILYHLGVSVDLIVSPSQELNGITEGRGQKLVNWQGVKFDINIWTTEEIKSVDQLENLNDNDTTKMIIINKRKEYLSNVKKRKEMLFVYPNDGGDEDNWIRDNSDIVLLVDAEYNLESKSKFTDTIVTSNYEEKSSLSKGWKECRNHRLCVEKLSKFAMLANYLAKNTKNTDYERMS